MPTDSSPKAQSSRASLICFLVGAALIFWAVNLHVQRAIEKQGMLQTTGVLMSFIENDWGEGFRKGTHNCPQVRFETVTGATITVVGSSCSKSSPYKVDDPITVFYSPENPEKALLVLPVDEWFYIALSSCFAAIFWFFALALRSPAKSEGYKPSAINNRIIPLSFGGIALVLCGVGVLLLYDYQAQKNRMSAMATGTVVSAGYHPTIEFQTPDNESFMLGTSVGGNDFDLGEQVPVLYDPVYPRHAMLDSFWEGLFLPVLLFGLGLPFLLPAIVFWPSASDETEVTTKVRKMVLRKLD